LLAIILGDPNRLEALRVLVTAEPCCERWKTIPVVGTLCLGYFTLSAPGINYGSHIASFIDSLAQAFWRILMIGKINFVRRFISNLSRWIEPDFRERCRCYCCAEVEDGRLPFDYDPGCDFRPRVLLKW
jgi:hypothetical protein